MQSEVGERRAMWLAIHNLVKETVVDGLPGTPTENGLDLLRHRLGLLRESKHLEVGMPAFDVGSVGLGLIDAAARRGSDDALSWLIAQVKACLDDAAAQDLG